MSVLDFEIKSVWTPNHPLKRFRYLVEFRPTKDDLRALGGRGVHTNWFFVDGARRGRLEEAIADYWGRKLVAADAGRPYAQHHKTTLNLEVSDGNDDALEFRDGSGFDSTSSLMTIQSSGFFLNQCTIVGTRFQNVTIPQGSTINACVWKGDTGGSSLDDARIDIYFNDVDDAANFVTEADVLSRTRTTASVFWNESNAGDPADSPDLSTVCQPVISRAGFSSGNALCVLLLGRFSGTPRSLQIASFEHPTGTPPQLDIDYEGPAAAAPIEVLAYMGDRP